MYIESKIICNLSSPDMRLHIPRKVSHYSAETEPPAVRVF